MESVLEADAVILENFVELGVDLFDRGEFNLPNPLTSNPDRLSDLVEGEALAGSGGVVHLL